MGVQPFLVASSVMAVMAQRLVRVICPKCKEPYQPDAGELQLAGYSPEQLRTAQFAKGRGCTNCQRTGYRGRKAVFEMMTMSSAMREMTFRSEPSQNLRRQARQMGMRSLMEDAADKALIGITTLQEVFKLQQGGH
jgi:type IV pilus assembly protein PilB